MPHVVLMHTLGSMNRYAEVLPQTIMKSMDVLETPELLSHIFRCSDNHTLTLSARVCKAWSASALDVFWADMSDIFPLLNILGRMVLVRSPSIFLS